MSNQPNGRRLSQDLAGVGQPFGAEAATAAARPEFRDRGLYSVETGYMAEVGDFCSDLEHTANSYHLSG